MQIRPLALVVALALLVSGFLLWREGGAGAGSDAAGAPLDEPEAHSAPAAAAESLAGAGADATGGPEDDATIAAPEEPRSERVSTAIPDRAPHAVVVAVDETGAGVAGARVDVARTDAGGAILDWLIEAAETDASGRCEVAPDVAAQTPLMVRVLAERFRVIEAPLRWTGAGWSARLELRSGSSIVGRVVDGSGAPLDAATIELTSLDGLQFTIPRAARGLVDGRFAVAGPAPGRYEIAAEVADLGRSYPTVFEVPPLGVLDVGTLTVSAVGSILGRVLLVDGTPVPDVLVRAAAEGEVGELGADSGLDVSEPDGSFTIGGLAEGGYTMSSGDPSVPVEPLYGVRPGTAGVDLLVDGWLLVVTAVDRAGAEVPLSRIEVGLGSGGSASARMQRFPNPVPSTTLVSERVELLIAADGPDGTRYAAAVRPDLPAGRHAVVLRTLDGSTGAVLAEFVGDGFDSRITGHVTLSPTGEGAVAFGAGARGERRVALEGVLPGRYQVIGALEGTDYGVVSNDSATHSIAGGGELRIQIQTAVGGQLRFDCDVAGAAPEQASSLAQGLVVLYRPAGDERWSRAHLVPVDSPADDLERSVRLASPVLPGAYELRATGAGLSEWTGSVVVVPREQTAVMLNLAASH